MDELMVMPAAEKIYYYKSKSGLRVFVWPYALSDAVSMNLVIKYGSMDTEFKVGSESFSVPNGLAHFLEHVKFNESKGETAHDYYTKLGSYVNAYTTYDHTCYEVSCSDKIEENLSHLLFYVFNGYFTKELVSKEKGIIVEESKSCLDSPYSLGYFKLLENLYHNFKRKNLVTGTPDEVKSITKEDVENVFTNYYLPDNAFLIVTGNVNEYEIKSIVEKYFENNSFKKANFKTIYNKEVPKVVKNEEVIKCNAEKSKLYYGIKIPSSAFKDYKDLEESKLLSFVLDVNFGTTSEFRYWLLDKKLIDDLYYSIIYSDDIITIILEANTDFPMELKEELNKKIDNLEVSKEEFERKIKCAVAEAILGFDSAVAVASRICRDIIRFDHMLLDKTTYYKKLTLDDALKVAKIINSENSSYVIVE